VVPKRGPVAFAPIGATAGELESKVRKLREALEPRVLRRIYNIPPFDLSLAYELYRLLLEPVEGGWKQATSLIVVTNGALGLLPLRRCANSRASPGSIARCPCRMPA
jgi:hypothetical protein